MQYRTEGRRGRSKGVHRSQHDVQTLEYLAKVTMKYEIDSDKFFNSLLEVYQRRKSQCGKLSIECRLKERDYAIFLITKGWNVVGQFRISEQLLKEKTNPLKESIYGLPARNLAKEIKPSIVKIKDLRVGMKRLNLNARVLEVSQPIQTATRSGLYFTWANALIADETGTINLSLSETQLKSITILDSIQIENAHVAWFRGERQLRVGKYGKIDSVGETAEHMRENKMKHK